MDADSAASDRGETLLELVITIAVTGIAVLVLIGGLGTSIRVSGIHRKQAVAGAYLRTFAEAVQTAVAASPSAYTDCAPTTRYASAAAYTPADPLYAATVTTVRYWDGSTFATTCTAGTDTGVQQISLRVRSTDNAVDETLDVIVRKPCRSTSDYPLDAPCS